MAVAAGEANFYELLGVARNASDSEIAAAADAFGGQPDAPPARRVLANMVFEALTDASWRAWYDAELDAAGRRGLPAVELGRRPRLRDGPEALYRWRAARTLAVMEALGLATRPSRWSLLAARWARHAPVIAGVATAAAWWTAHAAGVLGVPDGADLAGWLVRALASPSPAAAAACAALGVLATPAFVAAWMPTRLWARAGWSAALVCAPFALAHLAAPAALGMVVLAAAAAAGVAVAADAWRDARRARRAAAARQERTVVVNPDPWSASPPQTRFGAPLDSPAHSAATLRAAAARYGLHLGPAGTADLAAAVVAADAWLLVTGAPTFGAAASCGPGAAGSLAAVFARAAGQPVTGVVVASDLGVAPTALIAGLEESARSWLAWVDEVVGPAATGDVLRRAAVDLCWGVGPGSRLSQAGEYLAGLRP